MGDMRTIGMLEAAGFEAAFMDHITTNLYPPPDPVWYPHIRKAIELGAEIAGGVRPESEANMEVEVDGLTSPEPLAVMITGMGLGPFIAWTIREAERVDS